MISVLYSDNFDNFTMKTHDMFDDIFNNKDTLFCWIKSQSFCY